MNATCRPFLREILGGAPWSAATSEHLARCAFCRERSQARERLLPALRLRPQLRADSRDLLASIHARIVQDAEASPLGSALDRAMPVAMPEGIADVATNEVWSERLRESPTAALAQAAPTPPSAVTWSRVKGQILGRVAADAVAVSRRRWMVGVASAAAITIVLLANSQGGDPAPKIVFRDLSVGELGSLGSVDFVVVRHGVPR